MAARIGIIVIHGMGAQRPGFSHGLQAHVAGALAARAECFVWREVFWADVLERRETALWDSMLAARDPDGVPVPLDWRTVREFVVHNFGDAVAYHRDSTECTYADVNKRIDAGVRDLEKALGDPDAPIVVMAHSLGGHMMSNYIWDRQEFENRRAAGGAQIDPCEPIGGLTAMITFGCNIPLFSLSYDTASPITVPGRKLSDPLLRASARWLNFTDRDDVLGWPLKPLYMKHHAALTASQRSTVALIDDYEINVGSPLTQWNPASHASYWTDTSFITPVAAYLRSLADIVAPATS